jgi:hypothetical protein
MTEDIFNDDMEKQVYDVTGDMGTDIKINPDYYIHHALINAQQTFLKENMIEGFTQYIMFIEHVEVVCDSAEYLSKEYSKELETYKLSKDYTEETKDIVKRVKLANKKLNLMLKEVFSKKTATAPMTMTFRDRREKKEDLPIID